MILDEGKSRVLLDPKIYLVKLDDDESSLKWCEWWLGYGKENVSCFEVFLLMISWKEKSKALMDPNISFDDLGNWKMKTSNEDEQML